VFAFSNKSKEEIKENKQFIKEKNEFEQKFYRLMLELGLYNKFNRTYWLRIVEKTNYGFYAQLYLVDGLNFSTLKQKVGDIQESLCCIWIMKTKQFQDYADIKIVIKPLDEKLPYQNPELKPWQIYLGLSFTLNPIIVNMNKYCMFLLSGATGAGKTTLKYQILLSWILSCKPNEVEIYLSDIAKNEYNNFQHVQHVKYYASELNELVTMMEKVDKEFEKRKKMISTTREKGIATNIFEYNKVSKNKLSYIIVDIDELSMLLPDKSDSNNEKEMKQIALDILKALSKKGRGMGIFTFVATQKTTKDEMPSVIKNMSAVRISLRANDAVSSEVIMGDNSAVGLANRYAVYSLNGGSDKDYLFSPYLDTKMLNEMLEPYIDEKYRKKKSVSNKKVFDSSVIEITTKLKEYKGEINITNMPIKETKLVCLKRGEFVDY
jgi:hypothetical protein